MGARRRKSMADCPFCVRVKHNEYVSAGFNGHVVSFQPLNPVTPGHMLFLPAKHIEHLDADGPSAVGLCMEAASSYAQYSSMFRSHNLITSYGHDATQTVPHIHVHLVPRRPLDGLELPWGKPHYGAGLEVH